MSHHQKHSLDADENYLSLMLILLQIFIVAALGMALWASYFVLIRGSEFYFVASNNRLIG